MTELWRDIRYGFRLLWKSPGFTSVSLIALALGIGATTAIFSLLYSVLLAPLPYADSDRLVMVWSHQKGERNQTSPSDFLDWQKQSRAFDSLTAWTGEGFTIATPDWTEQVQSSRVTPGLFDLLFGTKLVLGRHFVAEDAQPGNDHVVILNNRFWRDRFGGDRAIVGTKLRMNGELYTVLGVAAPNPGDNGDSKMNVPLAFKPDQMTREDRYLFVMGKLKRGVTLEAANAEMAVIARQLAQSYPKTNQDLTVTVEPLKDDFLPKDTRLGLWLMMGAVGFVLLIACVNIANLLLAWGMARQKEIAVRASQGATRARIFRQFLIESLSLAMMGGALGTLLAIAVLRGLMSLIPRNQLGIPYEADPHLNVPVLLFTLAATLLSGVLFGCFPAWHAARRNLSDMLKDSGRSSSAGAGQNRLRRALVVAEFALALILVAGAGLILRSFWNLTQVDLGIRRDHVLTFNVPMQHDRTATSAQIRSVYQQLEERIAAVPGVLKVAIAPGLPAEGAGRLHFTIAGRPFDESDNDVNKEPQTVFMPVTPDFYQTYGVRLTRGRYLDARDRAGAPRVAMVSESFARQYLPGLDPLTQRVKIVELLPDHTPPFGAPVEWQIVGVFHDIQYQSHPTTGSAEVDVPFDQSPWPYTTIGVRTNGNPTAVTSSIAAAVRSVNPDYPITRVRTMDQVVSESLVTDRFTALVFGNFAGLALLLAAIGIYGVMTFSVAQRNHEMGIRIALGAGSTDVLKLVVGEGMRAALIGMALGLPGAYFVGKTLKSLLYNVGALDMRALGGVAIVLLASALVACYVPARRATKIDPLAALRQE
ncbi:MAG TPA: ABC transporter permease [Bryobacteraceae bacterium]|jgi:putative ABC transport system permease protein|nr:ABC transporter permease [Bryobacteraceae bacterium]